MRPLIVTSGEPAGIGPDICLALANSSLPIVVLADKELLKARAQQLNQSLVFSDYNKNEKITTTANHLTVLHLPCKERPIPGQLNPHNSAYVLNMLTAAVQGCLAGEFSGLVTAPVHKGVINHAGFAFTGHTEFLAQLCKVETVVMLLACRQFKVALMTTHVPLSQVASLITDTLITRVITCLHQSLQYDFGLEHPKICIAGLNPHAGEDGYLGREELDVIKPALAKLQMQKMDLLGPLAADTLFTPEFINTCDAFVAMYHDQGLPVLKHAGFGSAVNISLGLPIVRTSVDHGTALTLAGTGQAKSDSLLEAASFAWKMIKNRACHRD